MLLSPICAYATKRANSFGDAGGATSYPLFPCGGRGAEFYADGQEVRIHVWVKRRQTHVGCNAHADPSNGAEPIAALPSNVCSRSFGTTNSLSDVRQINGYCSLCAQISVHVLYCRRADSVSRRLRDRRHAD